LARAFYTAVGALPAFPPTKHSSGLEVEVRKTPVGRAGRKALGRAEGDINEVVNTWLCSVLFALTNNYSLQIATLQGPAA